MIKLNSLSRWVRLEVGAAMTLNGEHERKIRLEVNSPDRARLYTVDADGELHFLAAPVGCEVVEFVAGGNVTITTQDADVSVYSAEMEPTFVVIEDAEVFTQIAERQSRNPDLEHIMYMQSLNFERRMQSLAAESEARINAAFERGKTVAPAATTPSSPAPIAAPAGDAGVVGDGAKPAVGTNEAGS